MQKNIYLIYIDANCTPSSLDKNRANRSMFSIHQLLAVRQIVHRVEMYLGGREIRSLWARKKANHLLRRAAYFLACKIDGPGGYDFHSNSNKNWIKKNLSRRSESTDHQFLPKYFHSSNTFAYGSQMGSLLLLWRGGRFINLWKCSNLKTSHLENTYRILRWPWIGKQRSRCPRRLHISRPCNQSFQVGSTFDMGIGHTFIQMIHRDMANPTPHCCTSHLHDAFMKKEKKIPSKQYVMYKQTWKL